MEMALKGCMLLPLCLCPPLQGGDLYSALRHHAETMKWERLGRKVALDVALGLNYLHAQVRQETYAMHSSGTLTASCSQLQLHCQSESSCVPQEEGAFQCSPDQHK